MDGCTKGQLLITADHYKVEISDKRLKVTVKSILKANLYEMEILPGKIDVADAAGLSSEMAQSTLNSRRSFYCCKWSMRG